jgi:hypothetical protein
MLLNPKIKNYYKNLVVRGCRQFLVGNFTDIFALFDYGLHDHQAITVRGFVLMKPKAAYKQIPIILKANEKEITAGTDTVSGMICTINCPDLLMALDAHHYCNTEEALTRREKVMLVSRTRETTEHVFIYHGNQITRPRSTQIIDGIWPLS